MDLVRYGIYHADAGDPVRRSYGSRHLNTSTDVASTVMAGRRFQVGIVRGKNEYGVYVCVCVCIYIYMV